jgi:hypothetical protein
LFIGKKLIAAFKTGGKVTTIFSNPQDFCPFLPNTGLKCRHTSSKKAALVRQPECFNLKCLGYPK